MQFDRPGLHQRFKWWAIQPSGTTVVNGQFDDHCEFRVLLALAPENTHPTERVYHDMQVEVTKDGATIGTA